MESNFKDTSRKQKKKDFAQDKIVSFRTSLNELLDLSPKDVEQKLKASHNPNAAVDLKFLLAQREVPQRGFMDRVDEKDIERASSKRKNSSTPTNVERANESLSLSEESEIVESSSSGETFSDLSRTPRPDSVTLELPAMSLFFLFLIYFNLFFFKSS